MTAGIRQSKKFIFQKVPQKGLEIIGRHLINDTCYSTEGESGASEHGLGGWRGVEVLRPPKVFRRNICQVSLFVESCHVQSAAGPETGGWRPRESWLIHNNVLPSGMFLHTVAHCDMPDEFVRTCVQLLLQLFQDPNPRSLGWN